MNVPFTIGADPEFFLQRSAGELVSSIGLIGGSKDKPKVITKDGHAILEDNVAVEFNIPPSDNARDFIQHLNLVLCHLDTRATELGLEFAVNIAAASFPDSELNTPEAFIFGCEPDYNAWTKKVNPTPKASDPNLRSCGGHIHIGTPLDKIEVIRAMDLFAGVPSVVLDPDTLRRELYGKAGAFRPKPYGAEYRTLSNFWIWTDEMKQWAYDQTQRALEFVAEGNVISPRTAMYIKKAINLGDTNAVKHLAKTYCLAV